MPTGAMTLVEATKASTDQLKAGVVETIIEESPVIQWLPWIPFAGNALQHTEEGTLPNVQFRNVNEGYTPSWGTDNVHTWGIAILGGEVKIDKFLEDVVATRESLAAKQWAKMAKANSLRFSYEAFKGTGAPGTKGFAGINAIIDQGFGQKVENANGGGALTLAKIDEAIDKFKGTGRPDAAFLHRKVRRKITNLAIGNPTSNYFPLIDLTRDNLGRQVTMYDGIPLVVTGEAMDANGNIVDLHAYTENPGDGVSDCTSIHFLKLDTDNVCGILGKGGMFDVVQFGELESGPQRLGRFEWYPGVAIFSQFSAVRLYGITDS